MRQGTSEGGTHMKDFVKKKMRMVVQLTGLAPLILCVLLAVALHHYSPQELKSQSTALLKPTLQTKSPAHFRQLDVPRVPSELVHFL